MAAFLGAALGTLDIVVVDEVEVFDVLVEGRVV